MELRHLRYFVSVAEEGHFGRAARRLHMSQPPLSQQIRRLEEEVGAPLLSRSPNGVALTPAGRALLPEARLALAQADRALAAARRGARHDGDHFELGFVSSASYLLPRLLPAVRALSPGLSLAVREGSTTQQVELLRSGALAAALLRSPIVGSGLVTRTVTREPLIVALPATHTLAEHRELTLIDLADEPFVLFERDLGHALFDQITSACRTAGYVPDVVHTSSAMATIVHLVASGIGVSIVPASVAQTAAGVVFRSAGDLRAHVALDLTWREDSSDDAAIATVLQAARQSLDWAIAA
ncbi:LysR substrate-binding domain-containing protein [Conexibacter stalactiti]|uniref:LysR substrate-binding domain-containing protein n=1 Tax=Conexibacter stalactiti TaxID=1940611 RepID=A0ABU4HQP2_9ACTN|nr:LysR substrate-binding domain-containing protein [Conexibacter stalactiti]MDW5595064.1 LysR substrate-binding domain-containing protein [Conexibacter stalactiti]MEC5035706.1 LysR substrate-binding domain-containing protein [Conexibacter stalactiti]